MSDPFPGLPRRILFVDVTKPRVAKVREPNGVLDDPAVPWCSTDQNVTKPADVTKPKHVTKPKDVTKPTRLVTKPRGGRPSKSDKPMTSAERVRLHRAARKLGV